MLPCSGRTSPVTISACRRSGRGFDHADNAPAGGSRSPMDPSRKSGGALHRLHCFCLEFDGACEVQRRVPTDWIIEPIDVSGYGSFSLAS
jgi:hypothetical protein